MKLTTKNFLARAQRFTVRPAPGWSDVTLEEVQTVLQSPFAQYKFQPAFLNNQTQLDGDGNIVVLNCDWRQGMELSSRLTTAHDVQWVVEDMPCKEHKDLKKACYHFPFGIFYNQEKGVSQEQIDIRAQAVTSFANSSKLLKDFFSEGIERFVEPTASQPHKLPRGNIFTMNALSPLKPEDGRKATVAVVFKLKLINDRLTITANMCGEPLFKREYRRQEDLTAIAPLPEHHAAASFMWLYRYAFPPKDTEPRKLDARKLPMTFVVPFAGTGTLGVEALGHLLGSTPGSHTDRTFIHSSFHACPVKTVEFIQDKNKVKGVTAIDASSGSAEVVVDLYPWSKHGNTHFKFSDTSGEALESTKENVNSFLTSAVDSVSAAGQLQDNTSKVFFSYDQFDFLADGASNKIIDNASESQGPRHYYVLLNPPYGKRLQTQMSAVELYRRLGRSVQAMRYDKKKNTTGGPGSLKRDILVSGYCLCPDEETWRAFSSEKFASLFETKTRHFTHGGLDMRIIAFTSKQ